MMTKNDKPAPSDDMAKRAYAAYIAQKSIRERPRCPHTFEELDTEEQAAWRAAVSEVV